MNKQNKPIIFRTEMVRAILDGRKTQTRRAVKIKSGDSFNTYSIQPGYINGGHDNYYGFSSEEHDYKCPYGQPGATLWVRETFALDEWFYLPGHKEVLYKTDNIDSDYPVKWKPSIHMPKWACRIWLEIINIKVEKLQDIRMSDCEAEGAKDYLYGEYPNSYNIKKAGSCLRHNFHRLWDSINEKKHPWASNPWVWVVEFERIKNEK